MTCIKAKIGGQTINNNKNEHEVLISTKPKTAQKKYLIVILKNRGWLKA